jgi:hypothetical protein
VNYAIPGINSSVGCPENSRARPQIRTRGDLPPDGEA